LYGPTLTPPERRGIGLSKRNANHSIK